MKRGVRSLGDGSLLEESELNRLAGYQALQGWLSRTLTQQSRSPAMRWNHETHEIRERGIRKSIKHLEFLSCV